MNEPFVKGTQAITSSSIDQFNFKRQRNYDNGDMAGNAIKSEEELKKEIEE
jgi:hypothetical protein